MNSLELIGQVTAEILRNSIQEDIHDEESVARFLIDRLTDRQVAEICRTILRDPQLNKLIKIRVPSQLVGHLCLPAEILTDEKTTYWRNVPCEKNAILLANTDDDQGQSLRDITALGAGEIKSKTEVWIYVVSKSIQLTDEQKTHFSCALKGLLKAQECSLEQFSQYIVSIVNHMTAESSVLIDSLGWALPALKIPRDSGYFGTLTSKSIDKVNKWQNKYTEAFTKRACFLLKSTPNRQQIENEQLLDSFEKIKEDILAEYHPIIEKFIASNAGWTEEAKELAECEWERNNIQALFSEIKVKKDKKHLAFLTLEFFEDEYPDSLLDSEIDYLQSLKTRKSLIDSTDDDKDFYDKHRHELDLDRNLKAKWDRFVYGKSIECEDFLAGLILAIERLFEQVGPITGRKAVRVKTSLTKSKNKWLDINENVGLYFCARYKGLEELTSPHIIWDTHHLFDYDNLIKRESKKEKYKRNLSVSKQATLLKFYVELEYTDNSGESLTHKVQLDWNCNPNEIGMELYDDLGRLVNNSPFVQATVSRDMINKKGKLQEISLSNVSTLQAVYNRDKGSLVASYAKEKEKDVKRLIPSRLQEAVSANRITDEGAKLLNEKWINFTELYKLALTEWLEIGISSPTLIYQCEAYEELLRTLHMVALGDVNRMNLWYPILNIGNVIVEGGSPASIIAPWHPMRLAAIGVKARQISGLLKHIIEQESLDFGDSRLFFSDIISELKHPYYPEVTIGFKGNQPELLVLSDTVNDYSLMERPCKEDGEHNTNEDPKEATEKILQLIERYLDLQPHERTNLSIALYNCDSTKLPKSIVSALSNFHENDEDVRCQVILRHTDKEKLGDIYMKLIDNEDFDPDEIISSELTKDFMARLRISILAEMSSNSVTSDGKHADIVFLQDVISREAKTEWFPTKIINNESILEHVPPRWSKKRPSAKDELRSVTYLASPAQTSVGMAYLESVRCATITGENPIQDCEMFYLPAKQISFQEQKVVDIFNEAHELGEWVVNYDNLLDRKQLQNQGIKVIKYQQDRSEGRNLIVSSRSQLNLLQVLVKRRLDALNLGLSDDEMKQITNRFIEDANALSGDIVLRAAKQGVFASELIGVVLSKALLREEIGKDESIGWYFLDDYSSWLGQREQQIADILAISPKENEKGVYLQIILSESKYIDASNLANAKKTSQKQLRETVARFIDALFEQPGRIDRDLWLARLSDMLLDNMDFAQCSSLTFESWRSGIRNGSIPIEIRGYSHVFISGPQDNGIESGQFSINSIVGCYQEVFNRDLVRDLVRAYHRGESLLKVRERIWDLKPWTDSQPILPEPRIKYNVVEIDGTIENKRVTTQGTVNSTNKVEVTEQITIDNILTTTSKVTGIINQPKKEDGRNESSAKSLSQINFNILWENNEFQEWIDNNTTRDEENEDLNKWAEQICSTLKNAFLSYDLQAKVLDYRLTPNAVVVKMKGSDRLKVDDIERRRSQLLTTHAIDILNIVAQPGVIVLFIAREKRQTILLGDVWKRRIINEDKSGCNISYVLGVKEVDGELLYLNLGSSFEGLEQHAPHTLIAGATGSGKSVLLQNIILDICATNKRELAQIYLIDPKCGVDYFFLEELPHLVNGIITEQERAIKVLNDLVEEMDRRYLFFRENKVSSLRDYNAKASQNDRLPYLFLIHDEFAEWMLIDSYKETVSSAVQRLGVKARAAGIHLIFAAQRPDANVLPVQLRDNLGNRLILKVESVGTSEISLGIKGAEKLLGKGHLAAKLSGESEIIYAQVPFLSTDELTRLAEIIKTFDTINE